MPNGTVTVVRTFPILIAGILFVDISLVISISVDQHVIVVNEVKPHTWCVAGYQCECRRIRN